MMHLYEGEEQLLREIRAISPGSEDAINQLEGCKERIKEIRKAMRRRYDKEKDLSQRFSCAVMPQDVLEERPLGQAYCALVQKMGVAQVERLDSREHCDDMQGAIAVVEGRMYEAVVGGQTHDLSYHFVSLARGAHYSLLKARKIVEAAQWKWLKNKGDYREALKVVLGEYESAFRTAAAPRLEVNYSLMKHSCDVAINKLHLAFLPKAALEMDGESLGIISIFLEELKKDVRLNGKDSWSCWPHDSSLNQLASRIELFNGKNPGDDEICLGLIKLGNICWYAGGDADKEAARRYWVLAASINVDLTRHEIRQFCARNVFREDRKALTQTLLEHGLMEPSQIGAKLLSKCMKPTLVALGAFWSLTLLSITTYLLSSTAYVAVVGALAKIPVMGAALQSVMIGDALPVVAWGVLLSGAAFLAAYFTQAFAKDRLRDGHRHMVNALYNHTKTKEGTAVQAQHFEARRPGPGSPSRGEARQPVVPPLTFNITEK